MHAWWSEYDGMRLIMASIGLSRTQLSTSGLQVGDLKASVTPSLHRCCVDVSVSCSCAHLQGQHDARSRPLLLRSLGPKVSEGTRHHRHALDGLPACRAESRARLRSGTNRSLFPDLQPPTSGPRLLLLAVPVLYRYSCTHTGTAVQLLCRFSLQWTGFGYDWRSP